MRDYQPPTPSEIRELRVSVGHTQKKAAATVFAPSYRTWQNYESKTSPTPIPQVVWEYYKSKVRNEKK